MNTSYLDLPPVTWKWREMEPEYRDGWSFNYFVQSIAKEWAKIKPSGAALDIGTGIGGCAQALASCGLDVTAVDIDTNVLADADKLALSRNYEINFQQASMFDLPFADSSFKFVTFPNTVYLTNTPGMIKAIREAIRVLEPDGVFYANFISKNDELYKNRKSYNVEIIDENTLAVKTSEDSQEFYCFSNKNDLRKLFPSFILNIRKDSDRENGQQFLDVVGLKTNEIGLRKFIMQLMARVI